MRNRFDHTPDRQIVVRDRCRGARLARRGAVGVIVRQVKKHESWKLSAGAFLPGTNEIVKLVEENVGAELVGIGSVEVRKERMVMITQSRLGRLHALQQRNGPRPRAW